MAPPSFPKDPNSTNEQALLRGRARRRALQRIGLFAAVTISVTGAALAVGCGSEDGNVDEAPAPTQTSTKSDAAPNRPSTDAGKPPQPDPEPDPDPVVDAGFDAGQPEGGLQPDGTCFDPSDPTDTDAGRQKLPDTDDDQDEDIRFIRGVLNGAADVDQFSLSMEDKQGHLVGKGFTARTPDVEVCVYATCKAGRETTVTCENDAGAPKKLGTREGCCATNAWVPLKWDCKGAADNDSADFVINVSQKKDACTTYQVDYTF